MSIEVRQMVVKSNVVQRAEQDNPCGEGGDGLKEETKREMLDACRKLILEVLRERGER